MTDIDMAVRSRHAPASILSLYCLPLAIWLGVPPATGQETEPQPTEHLQAQAPHQESPTQEPPGDAPPDDTHAPRAEPEVPVDAHGDHGSPGQAAAAEHGHGRETAEVRLTPEQGRTLGLVTDVAGASAAGGVSARARRGAAQQLRNGPGDAAHRGPGHRAARAPGGPGGEAGQPLATLSSVEMAVAQGDLVVAEREWQQLTKLGDQFVSDSSYLEASVARQKALSRAAAFGMTPAQIDALLRSSFERRTAPSSSSPLRPAPWYGTHSSSASWSSQAACCSRSPTSPCAGSRRGCRRRRSPWCR